VNVDDVVELRSQVNMAMGVRSEVLDDVAEDLSQAHEVANVVEGVDRSNEESNLFDGTHHFTGYQNRRP
jgi:hypothetical protein